MSSCRVLLNGKWGAAVFIAIAICGSGEAKRPIGPQEPDYSAFKPISLEDLSAQAKASLSSVRKMLEDALVDSERARLRSAKAYYVLQDMEYSTKSMRLEGGAPRMVVCVELNAPNRMGGMTGWQTIALTPSIQSIETDKLGIKCPTATWKSPYVGPVDLPTDELLPSASASR